MNPAARRPPPTRPALRRQAGLVTAALVLAGSALGASGTAVGGMGLDGGALDAAAATVSPTTTTSPIGPTTTAPPPVITDKAGPDGKTSRDGAPTIIDSRLDPDLAHVAADSPEYRSAIAAYRATQARLQTATGTLDDATRQIAELTAADARLTGTLTQAVRRRDKSQARLDQLQQALAKIAVADYVNGNTASLENLGFDPAAAADREGDHVVIRTVRKQQLAEVRAHRRVVDDTTATAIQTQAELDEVTTRLASETRRRDQAQADQQRETVQVVTDARAVGDARLTSDVKDQEYSLVALDAYVKAAKTMAVFQPACRIRWSLLAAISRTEGRHGTYGGARLTATGDETKPIIGISLDGSGGTATVADTDGGAIDGDPTTDRAVGPMQFIPSTWTRWGRDGNHDGKIDPQNLYDAALAAADYLCYFGPNLDTDDGISGAVIHYNADQSYVELVLARAKAYDTFTFGS